MKIGLGVITCNREEYFKQCIERVGKCTDKLHKIVVVNDGKHYSTNSYPDFIDHVEQHPVNKCVAAAKNFALRYLMQNDCEALFLIEDDILIDNPEVFQKYIDAATESGIWHMNFGLHGPANKGKEGEPNPRQIVEYDNQEVCLYPHCVGAFSFYYKGVIKNAGYFDERYKNAWEHVSHTMKIIEKGMHPPFWWFADIKDSDKYLSEIPESIKNSSICTNPDHQKNIRTGMRWYNEVHGFAPMDTPDMKPEDVFTRIEFLETHYSRK